MWMNAMEVDEAVYRTSNAPVRLHKAALYLQSFKNLIDSISDGWPYWSYGTKCSADLQKIIHDAQWPINRLTATATPQKEIDAAKRKIRTFLVRCRQTKFNPGVIAWLKENK